MLKTEEDENIKWSELEKQKEQEQNKKLLMKVLEDFNVNNNTKLLLE
jgi:hypothetical protein